jgi:hypothetical protein
MAMVVAIDEAIGVTPTWTAGITAVKWNGEDTAVGAVAISTPVATGTNFSFIKSFAININTVNSLTMTAIKFGKVATEATAGTKLWYVATHAIGSYVQATAAPTPTGDNNVTAPTMNSAAGTAVPLIAGASAYDAGPYNTTGRHAPLVEVCLGVDFTNTTAGATVATPTLRWSWVEG